MKYIAICSPDKISLNMFVSFLRAVLLQGYAVGEVHSLMQQEAVAGYIANFKKEYEKGIFTYYAKRVVNIDPLTILPGALMDACEVVIWFDLYSTDPKVLKDTEDFMRLVTGRWKANIERMNQNP